MGDKIRELETQLAAMSNQAQNKVSRQEKIDTLNALAYELRAIAPERIRIPCEEAYALATTGEFEDQPYQKGLAESLLNLGWYHLRQSNHDLALSHFVEALSYFEPIAKKVEAKRKLFECHQALTETYKQIGDFESALAHCEQCHIIKEDVFNKEAEHKLKILEVVHQVETAKKETEIYQLKNVKLEQEIAERKQTRTATDLYRETLQQHNRELALLNRVGQAFSSTLNLDQVLDIVLEETRRLLNVVTASLWLRVPDTDGLVCQQAKGPGNEIVQGWRLAPGEGLVGWVAENGQSLIIPDAREDERYFRGVDQKVGLTLCSILSMPLQAKGEVIGVLNLADTAVGRFTEEDLMLLEPLVASAAIAIENARLHTAAQKEIVERQRAEAALRQLNEELEQRVEARTQELQTEIAERKRADAELTRSHEELITLNAIATMISQSRDSERILTTVLDLVLAIVEPSAGYIQLFEGDEDKLFLAAHSGFPPETTEAMKTVQSALSPAEQSKSQTAALANKLSATVLQNGWRHLTRVPLNCKDAILGYIEIFSRDSQKLELQQIQLLKAIGQQVGMAIENERLSKEAAEARVTQELDLLRSELIGNVSHELRTPLGLIKAASTTLLAKDVEFDQETQEILLRGIGEETDRLEYIVNNLLDLSRLEQKRLRLDYSATDIGQLIQNVAETMQPQIQSDLQVVYDFSAQALVANVDSKRIEQVLRNLLTNAVKYSPGGGTITIEGRQERQELFIQVSDQGIGISLSDQKRIFERFYRVENEATRDVSGVGLGLTISREIIESHGGRMGVKSEVGTGSTFCFTLPIE